MYIDIWGGRRILSLLLTIIKPQHDSAELSQIHNIRLHGHTKSVRTRTNTSRFKVGLSTYISQTFSSHHVVMTRHVKSLLTVKDVADITYKFLSSFLHYKIKTAYLNYLPSTSSFQLTQPYPLDSA